MARVFSRPNNFRAPQNSKPRSILETLIFLTATQPNGQSCGIAFLRTLFTSGTARALTTNLTDVPGRDVGRAVKSLSHTLTGASDRAPSETSALCPEGQ